MSASGTMLTHRQTTELFHATFLIQSLKRMLQGIEHEGDHADFHRDLAGMGALVGTIEGKLDTVVCEDEKHMTQIARDGMLSGLIWELQNVLAAYGDMKVFNTDMKPIALEVCQPGATPDDADDPLSGQTYLCLEEKTNGAAAGPTH